MKFFLQCVHESVARTGASKGEGLMDSCGNDGAPSHSDICLWFK